MDLSYRHYVPLTKEPPLVTLHPPRAARWDRRADLALSISTLAELETALHGVHAEAGQSGGGLLTLDVIQPIHMPELLSAALYGDPMAQRLFDRTSRATRDVYKAPRKLPKSCAYCPRRIRRGNPFSLVLATPSCDDPRTALALAVCSTCGPHDRQSESDGSAAAVLA